MQNRFGYLKLSAAIFIALFVACSLFGKKDVSLISEGSKVIEMEKSKVDLDDGDSFKYGDMGIRVLGMDTPEISHPEHGFHEDQPFGREAAAMTAEIFEKAKKISYLPYQNDKYNRMLAHVFIDGNLLSTKLIEAGLAYETVSFYGDNGFPKLAERILEVAKKSKTKDFIPPYKWRQQHRKANKSEPIPEKTKQ
ncbi:MAG: thermonuclease family protein [candidate division Zixibacteria bacterium]|nr:thermonuclease family protein [candidate division Zixibacteria bacterium]